MKGGGAALFRVCVFLIYDACFYAPLHFATPIFMFFWRERKKASVLPAVVSLTRHDFGPCWGRKEDGTLWRFSPGKTAGVRVPEGLYFPRFS